MSLQWSRLCRSLISGRTHYALRPSIQPFATKSQTYYCEDQPDKSWKRQNHQGQLTKDRKYKEVMTAEKWHGDLMAHKKEAKDVIPEVHTEKDVIKQTEEHVSVSAVSKNNIDLAELRVEHRDIIAASRESSDVISAPDDPHSLIPSLKELKNVITKEQEKLDVTSASKEEKDVMKAQKEHRDITKVAKEHGEIMQPKAEPHDIAYLKNEEGSLITATPEHHEVTARTEKPGDVMTATTQHGDIMKSNEVNEDAKEKSQPLHIPVMSTEVLELMDPQDGQIIFDLTFGAGGHTKQILERAPGCTVYALDRDPQAHELAKQLSQQYEPGRIVPLLGRFSELPGLLSERGIGAGTAHAVLMDLGASSMQFDQPTRGFRVSADGPLDMRMDGDRLPDQLTAADVVNSLDEVALTRILSRYGEEKLARSIATAIVETRYAFGDITTTGQLIKVINSVFSEGYHRQDKLRRHSHVATKTFQALRIFVNDELNELAFGLRLSHRLLARGGACVAISFHSLEDRLVKRAFSSRTADDDDNGAKKIRPSRESQSLGKWALTETHFSHAITAQDLEKTLEKRWSGHEYYEPSSEEVAVNPRARSAKLRVARKL